MVSLSGMVGGSSWLGTWATVGVPVGIALLLIWVVQNGVKTRKGPIRWPLLGSTVEVLWNYDHLNDWLVPYFEKYKLTFRCVLVDTSYVFTADPANVEYILKTNFNNYPKVCMYAEHHNLCIRSPCNVWGSSATVVSSMLQVEYRLYPILRARSFVKLGFIGHPQNQFPTIIPRFVLTWSIIFRYPSNVCRSSAIVSQFYIAGEVYTISCNIDLGLPAS